MAIMAEEDSKDYGMETERRPPTPPPPPAASAERPCPLNESDFLVVRQAAVRRKAVRAAAHTSLVSAVITMGIGVLALVLSALWGDWGGALVAMGVCTVGAVEYLGHRRMRRADPAAARMLGWNQLAFLGLIFLYCLVQMLTYSTDQAKAAALSPEVRSQLEAVPNMEKDIDQMIERWAPLVTYGLYGLIMLLSLGCQGGMALYYFTRRRRVEAFTRQTAAWVRRLFIETGA